MTLMLRYFPLTNTWRSSPTKDFSPQHPSYATQREALDALFEECIRTNYCPGVTRFKSGWRVHCGRKYLGFYRTFHWAVHRRLECEEAKLKPKPPDPNP
jgi:hypothetical protein